MRRMQTALWGRRAALVPLLAAWTQFVAGCAAPQPIGRIPLGRWEGEGVVVYKTWKEGEADQAIQRRYATKLVLRESHVAGRPVIELEIISRSGSLPELDDGTHIRAALKEDSRPSENATLYRLTGFQFNPEPDQELTFDQAGPLAASAISLDGVTTVQIQYMDNFVDTMRFENGRVEKSGVAFDVNEDVAQWFEVLHPQE